MKRILISITNSFDQDRRMIRTSQALQDLGYDVRVISKGSSKQVLSAHTTISCWARKGIFYYIEFNIRLFTQLLISPTDILLSVDSDTLLANALASILKRKPLVIDMHELFAEVPELANSPIKKSIWRWIERFGIQRSTKRYTVSQTIADEYEKRYGQPFDVIRNVPIPTGTDNLNNKPDLFTIAYVGALNMGRGLEPLIRAMSSLEDVQLMIYGTGDLDIELKKLANQLQLNDRIHFTGWIDPSTIHDHLQKAHIGINLLDSTSQSYQLSLANKYFDYIHAGLPILSMNFPEYRTLNQTYHTSILVDDLEEATISDAIHRLKNDTQLHTTLSDNCLLARAQWNWPIESKRLVSIFDL